MLTSGYYSDLNKLVLNYLISEGYASAAVKFSEEAGITPKISTDCIGDRIQIRSAINRGDIKDAIRMINELNPEVSFQASRHVDREGEHPETMMISFMHHSVHKAARPYMMRQTNFQSSI